MSSEIIKFSECGDSARKELAGKVLLGQACICVLITFDCFGLSKSDPGYETVNDVRKRRHENKHDNPFLDRFDTGRYLEFDHELKKHCTTEHNWFPDHIGHNAILDYRALNNWIKENNRIVKPGLYELTNSQEIAAEVVSGNPADLYQVNGPLQNWSLFRGVFIRMGEDTWELLRLDKMYNRFLTFEENGNIYCEASLLRNVPLVFRLQNSKSASVSRQSDLDYLIGLYLDETENAGGLAGFKRFMTEKHGAEIVPGNRITWPVPGSKPKKLAISTIRNKLSKTRIKRKA